MGLGGVTSSRPRAAPARPGSCSESIPIPAARGSICILFLSPLRRPVAKNLLVSCRISLSFWGQGNGEAANSPWRGG